MTNITPEALRTLLLENECVLDKKEWRSFRIANVISAKVKDETNTVQP